MKAEKTQRASPVKKALGWAWVLLLSLGVVALLAFAPQKLDPLVSRDIYLDWLTGPDIQWRGRLNVWNVYDDQTRLEGAFLQDSIRRFEKAHKGVYAETVTLSLAQAQAQLEGGYSPDVLIFPSAAALRPADAAFELPVPQEQKVIKEDFEFDILAPEQTPPPIQTDAFSLTVLSIDHDFAQNALELALFIASHAANMVE